MSLGLLAAPFFLAFDYAGLAIFWAVFIFVLVWFTSRTSGHYGLFASVVFVPIAIFALMPFTGVLCAFDFRFVTESGKPLRCFGMFG